MDKRLVYGVDPAKAGPGGIALVSDRDGMTYVGTIQIDKPWSYTSEYEDAFSWGVGRCLSAVPWEEDDDIHVFVEYSFSKVNVGAGMYVQAIRAITPFPEKNLHLVSPNTWRRWVRKTFGGFEPTGRKEKKQWFCRVAKKALDTSKSLGEDESEAVLIALYGKAVLERGVTK